MVRLTTSLSYDPYGVPQGASQPTDYGFTGEPQVAGLGLVHLRARWYAPSSGTFLRRDPFPGSLTSPASLHPYAYAHNDPIRFIDPTGRCRVDYTPDGFPTLGMDCSNLQAELASTGNFLANFADGLSEPATDTLRLATDGGARAELVAGLWYAATHPHEIPGAIWDDMRRQVSDLCSGDPERMGLVLGRSYTNTFLAVIGPGAASGRATISAGQLPRALANKASRLIRTPRQQALRELLEEAGRNGVTIHSGEEAQQLLDWSARVAGADPADYHAVTLGKDIFVRPQYVDNVRLLREELIHVYQQTAGQDSARIVDAEIQARLMMIRFRHPWAITNDEVREMIHEVRRMRATGRY